MKTKRLLLTTLLLTIVLVTFGQEAEPKLDFFAFIKNHDWINVVLVAAMSIGAIAGFVGMARSKIKQVGDLLILLYIYTDDKVLSEEEREDIWTRILVILGKRKAEDIKTTVLTEVKEKGITQVVKEKSSFRKSKAH